MIFVYLLIILLVIWLVFGSFYSKQNGILSSILFTIEVTLIIWLNMPLLVTVPDGATFNPSFIEFPFKLYQLFGLGYSFTCNALLTIIGVPISSAMINKKPHCSKKVINKQFNDYIENATSLKIIGKDLDFLLRDDCKRQKERLLDLKDSVEILCANPYSCGMFDYDKLQQLIALYNELAKQGNKIRFYNDKDGISNLLGQIKVDNQRKESGLFVYKLEKEDGLIEGRSKSKFTYEKHINGYLVDIVRDKFDETFNQGLNPIVKYVALDIGGVYLNGDVDNFRDFLLKEYKIALPKSSNDRLDLNSDLSTGKINILKYVENACDSDSKKRFKALSKENKETILRKWNSTWQKDEKAYLLVEKLLSLGYEVIPFSNVDKDNGDMYIREHYFPVDCRHFVFSYKYGVSKEGGALFEKFVDIVNKLFNDNSSEKTERYQVEGYQILLIDDHKDNVNTAKSMGWNTIHFDKSSGQTIDDLIMLLKEKSMLPQDFKL